MKIHYKNIRVLSKKHDALGGKEKLQIQIFLEPRQEKLFNCPQNCEDMSLFFEYFFKKEILQ